MENQRPLILISNDDGIIAKGISELIKFLQIGRASCRERV